ncbi:hypothetical protein PC116_g19969 [Phytophthora cactorum]|uniref:Uncharacterized protein n=1 Tax=Phytophthora cactorum TaxID=29920 RepID=A0A8T1K906_9STRA|nr:hypothetical protein PC117_g16834 [Phytophthora cactorum]KAG4231778.1 hypothetical protein PC116_g19969 [Phytophthora cactorum]
MALEAHDGAVVVKQFHLGPQPKRFSVVGQSPGLHAKESVCAFTCINR